MRVAIVIGFAVTSAALLGSTVGCAGKEQLDPNPQPSSTAIADAGPPDAAPDDAAPVTAKRQVLSRNPVGGPPHNLLVDGDFEMSIVPNGQTGQYGWTAFTAAGAQAFFWAETGGNCRSGVRCARGSKGQLLFGRGTAAPDKAKMDASVWLKPIGDNVSTDPAKACKPLADITLVKCDSFATLVTLAAPASQGADGWCEFHGVGSGSQEAICMVVDLQADALVDAAVMLPVESQTTEATPYLLDTAKQEKLTRLGAIINGRMRFAEPTKDRVAPRY